jgi:hypothetical protein
MAAQLDHHMEPRRNALHSNMRQMSPESVHQLVSPGTVDEPGFSEVAVEFSTVEKVGESELIEYR